MNSTTTKSLVAVTALAAAAGAMSLAGPAISTTPASHSARKPADRSLTGTWLTTVQLTDAPPGVATTFNALDTFAEDGALLVSSSAPNPASRGLAHGTWRHQDHHRFTSSFTWFRFDASGAYAGTQRVERTMKLARDGKSFTATDVVQVIAPTGAVVATIHGTESGQLMPG